ncbi:MAG: hypothetical protein H6923_04270 [Alphaproteobacteria bacterium]|nr:hypothetical protein [Alphaproteobacteria bacterium]
MRIKLEFAPALGLALAVSGAGALAAEEVKVGQIPADAKIVFSSDRAGEKSPVGFPAVELYVASLEGKVTRITYSKQVANHFAVSPDRTMIATNRYSRGDTNKDGRLFPSDHKELWIVDVVKGTERVVNPDTNAGNGGLAWFPDSRHVIFGTQTDQGMDLVKVDIETGEEVALTRNLNRLLGKPQPTKFVSDVDVSPDGNWLVFVYGDPGKPGEIGRPLITVMKADGSEARIITDGGDTPRRRRGDWPNGDFDPDFSPDGTMVSFQRQTEAAMVYPSLSSADVMIVKTDGTGLKRISPEGNLDCHGISSWGPDGIIFTDWARTSMTPTVADPATGTLTRVPIEGNASHVQWIPPGP